MSELINLTRRSSARSGPADGRAQAEASEGQVFVLVANDDGEPSIAGMAGEAAADIEPSLIVIDDEDDVVLTGDGEMTDSARRAAADLAELEFAELDPGDVDVGDGDAPKTASVVSVRDRFRS